MTTYTTAFPNSEQPLSEGGNWTNAASGTWTIPVSSAAGSPGHASGPGSASTNDSVAFLTGSVFGNDQSVTTTVFGAPYGGAELEVHLRGTATAGPDKIFTYEFDFFQPRSCAIVRWDGTQGTFVDLTGGGITLPAMPTDGDTIICSVSGAKGSVLLSFSVAGSFSFSGSTTDTDGTNGLASGSPGIGFDNATSDSYGFKGFTASDGALTPPLIISGPTDLTIDYGTSATFSVNASSQVGALLHYQWTENTSTVTNATNSAITLTTTGAVDQNEVFAVSVWDTNGTTNSGVGVLRLNINGTGYYLQEDGTSKYQLEDASGFYILESWATSAASGGFVPPFWFGDLDGIGRRFRSDRLN